MNYTFSFSDVLLISPMIILFLASILPITLKVLKKNEEPPALVSLLQGLMGLAAAATLLVIVSGSGATAFSQALVFDGLTRWLGLITIVSAMISLLLMHDGPATRGEQMAELVFLTLNSVVGMLILISANDLLMTFIGLEMMSLSLYMMIAMSHEQKLSKESAFKYFVLGSVASAIFLYGIALIFGSAGTTYVPEIVEKTAELINSNRLFMIGGLLIILGYCFKVAIAPFHAWTPDVYEGAPSPHTAFMATAVKVASFAAFIRFISTKNVVLSVNTLDILQWLAVITIIVGNTAAILQNNFKRVLAYSSIAHSGYLLIGLIAVGVTDTPAALGSVVFYLFSYCAMTLGAFAVVSQLEKNEDSQIGIDDLAGLSKRHPILAICLTFFLLSLAGIPPLMGFFSKFYLFSAAIGEGLLWLAIWGVLGSVISVYYYLRPIVVMYMKEGETTVRGYNTIASRIAVLVTVLAVLCLGLVSAPVYEVFEAAFRL